MGDVRCSGCGGTNVDYEGYCWSCGLTNQVGGTPPPPWLAEAPDPFADLPALPPKKTRSQRIVSLLIPPLATVVVIFCAVGSFFTYRLLDSFMNSQPEDDRWRTGNFPREQLARCVPGTWRHSDVELELNLGSLGLVKATGQGGTTTFAADGTGSEDYSSRVLTAMVRGKKATFNFAGTTSFRYTLGSGTVDITDNVHEIYMSITVDGGVTPIGQSTTNGTFQLGCAGDELRVSNLAGKTVSHRVPTATTTPTTR